MIKVNKPGLQTTVQDLGRIGFYEIGMPPSGAMDTYSHRIANLLVGNDENDATLEITYMGPELEFQEPAVIAVTGGEIQPRVNMNTVPMWESIRVASGDKLTFDFVKSGARVYLAISGGIDVPLVLGSRSTYTLCGMGGFEGRALAAGDVLSTGVANAGSKEGIKLAQSLIPSFGKCHEIQVMVGLCSYRLNEESKERFLQLEWLVTPEANRVGYRFKGERLNFVPREQPFGAGSNPSNVVDLGYPIGSIQVPDGVEPIALLNDAVTGGGYATVATIISADLRKMAQVKTNERVKFVSVSLEDALTARRDQQNKLHQARQYIQQAL